MANSDKNKSKSVSIDELKKEVETKKKEAKAIQKASEDLAEENNVPVETDPDEIPQGDKLLACLGYIHFLCILPLILRQESGFCQFHGKQGLVITLFFLLLGVVTKFLGKYYLSSNIFVTVCWIALALVGIVAAWKGQKKEIPVVASLAKQLNW